MKVLITGTNGLVGQQLLKRLLVPGIYELIAVSRGPNRTIVQQGYVYEEADLLDAVRVHDIISLHRPDIIVHSAAMTQADLCETNPVLCWNTNVTATRFLLHAALQCGAHFIFLSTDFVFSGEDGPYKEDDLCEPVNYYGSSKLAAERSVMHYEGAWSIIRTVLVYGNSDDPGRSNILTWAYHSLKQGKPIKVVNDQLRTPTYVDDLTKGIELLIAKKAMGIFHISGKEQLTPYEIAIAVADKSGFDKALITSVTADTFTQPAKRPPKTGFIIEKARRELGYEPRSFQETLDLLFPLQS
jgi:dTDP-4-dehydrorhamnose reductase